MKADRAAVALAERAVDQWGLVTAAQAAADGISAVTLTRLTTAGVLHRLAQGIYQVVGATDLQHIEEKVAWLRLAPERPAHERKPLDADGGVLSHHSAALLHNIGDLVASRVEITVPVRRQTRDRTIIFHREQLTEADVTRAHGLLPVTTIERTIADLTAEHLDGGHIGDLIADASARGVLNTEELARRLAPYRSAYGLTGDGHELIDYFIDQAGRKPQEPSIPQDILLALINTGAVAALAAVSQQSIRDLVDSIVPGVRPVMPEATKLAKVAVDAMKFNDESMRTLLDTIRTAIPPIDPAMLATIRRAMTPYTAEAVTPKLLLEGPTERESALSNAAEGSSEKEAK